MTPRRLFGSERRRIYRAMRAPALLIPVLIVALCLGLALRAAAQTHHATRPAAKAAHAGPKELGKFEDWIAATHQESGATVCYAFTRAKTSVPAVPGREQVILTVTQRPTSRDAVAISAGFAFPQGASMTVAADQTGLDFYTAGRNAFARDGRGAVAALLKAGQATARAPGPRGGSQVADTFSLRGFGAAYAAIVKACPAK